MPFNYDLLTAMLFNLSIALATNASPAGSYNIPKVQNISIDGDPADWKDDGFRVDSLADLTDDHANGFEARFRLAWDDRGLLSLFFVTDPTPCEEADDKLSNADSVKIMLATGVGADDSVDLVISPGRDVAHPVLRKMLTDNRTAGKFKGPPVSATVARSLTAGGYIVEVLIPWANLALQPKVGQTIAVQACVNDAQAPGVESESAWFPANGANRTENTFGVQLSDHASPPVRAAVWGVYKHFRTSIRITAASDAGADFTAAWSGGDAIHGTLQRQGDHWSGLARIPLPPDTDPDPALLLTAGKESAPPLRLGKFKGDCHAAFIKEPIQFDSVVFSGDKFPACEFRNPDLVENLIGAYTLHTVFYNAKFQPVTKPDLPGRYGVIVNIQAQSGEIARQFVTLFRTAKPANWREASGISATTLPAESGIDPAVTARKLATISDFAQWNFDNAIHHDTYAPIMLSWLGERTTGDPINRPFMTNAKWWFDLKQKLGLPDSYPYLIQKPASYDQDADKRWPAIVFLSGVGERGDNLKDLLHTGLPKWVQHQKDFPFLVISPQCPDMEDWNVWQVNALLDRLSSQYRIDPQRIYLTGLSMGGGASWMMAATFPKRFAAVAPISSGDAEPVDILDLKEVPLWVFHGGKDEGLDSDNRSVARDRQSGEIHGLPRCAS